MMIISSKTDIKTYVDNSHPDFDSDALRNGLVDAIQGADHPAYGSDWSEWLDANMKSLRDEAAPARVFDPAGRASELKIGDGFILDNAMELLALAAHLNSRGLRAVRVNPETDDSASYRVEST